MISLIRRELTADGFAFERAIDGEILALSGRHGQPGIVLGQEHNADVGNIHPVIGILFHQLGDFGLVRLPHEVDEEHITLLDSRTCSDSKCVIWLRNRIGIFSN